MGFTDLEQTGKAIDIDSTLFSETDLRKLQTFEDRVNEAIMILETNSDAMVSLRSFYEELPPQVSLPWIDGCKQAINQFSAQINEMINDIRMHVSHGKVLIKISGDRKHLVRIRALFRSRQLLTFDLGTTTDADTGLP